MNARRSRPPGGFTLIELLTVITIMAILAGMILGGAAYVQRKSAESKARAEMERIKGVLEAYRVQFGEYPTQANTGFSVAGEIRLTGMSNLLRNTSSPVRGFRGADPDTPMIDPWGRGYVYTNVLRYSYELLSFGPRGGAFPADNLSNRGTGP